MISHFYLKIFRQYYGNPWVKGQLLKHDKENIKPSHCESKYSHPGKEHRIYNSEMYVMCLLKFELGVST